jgi:hypothetical protein
MTSKWADFLVVAVRYSPCGSHIESVQIVEDLGNSTGAVQVVTRHAVVDAIRKGTTFCSATKGTDGKWKKGAAVDEYPVTTHFIKTVADKTERDNLDHLPRF